ncbi:MAG: carbamate kinase [Bacteroidales bacterium]|jgi:carbamate kinase|nr:carbamate kinase [Bacteroidales bacterium]
MRKTLVIAFGGNALLQAGEKGTAAEQWANVSRTCKALVPLIKQGHNIVIGHGNGPQVGNELLRQSAGKSQYGLEEMPMDFCVAETQGSIGYMIELALLNEGIDRQVVTLLSPVVVDEDDKAFQNPTKPVGPYYKEKQEGFKEDPKGNGWRKVVASPAPKQILHSELIKQLSSTGTIVITVGGGGIPVVVQSDGKYKSVEAVIDKDLASALLAQEIGADELYILTDVPNACINFRQENEQVLNGITLEQAKKYLDEGHFKEGSMAPKIRAAIKFASGVNRRSIITTAANLDGGTRIANNEYSTDTDVS